MSAVTRLAIDGGPPVIDHVLPVGRGLAVFGDEERRAALEVLESRSLFRYYGPALLEKVTAFEDAACSLLGAGHAVAVSSGTAALRVALAALGVGCGDEVIVPAFTFIATVNAVVSVGAVPVFAEVDTSWGLSPASVAARLTVRTAAIIPVHLENSGCDMDGLVAAAGGGSGGGGGGGRGGRGVPIIEDAAQAMGASYRGRALGTIGTLGCYSLQLEKNVTAGEGGLVVTDDPSLYLRAARYQDQGGQFVTSKGLERGTDEIPAFAGENLRMTEIAGAIASAQLAKLPDLLARQRQHYRRIVGSLSLPLDGRLTLRTQPDPEGDGCSSVGFLLPTPDTARRFARALIAEGVPAGRMYGGRPVYSAESILQKQTASNKGGPWHCAEHPTAVTYEMGMCPETEDIAARHALVVVAPGYTEEDCDLVAEAINKVAAAVL